MDNHINMVKFSSPTISEFKRVSGHLKLMADAASTKVQENWSIEGTVEAGK